MAEKNLGHYKGNIAEVKSFADSRHEHLYSLYKYREYYQKLIDNANAEIKRLEKEIKPEIESGEIDWAWIWLMKRTNVKWKEEFINHLGTGKAKEVQRKYDTKEYPQVGIRGIHPDPDTIIQTKANKPTIPLIKFKLKTK